LGILGEVSRYTSIKVKLNDQSEKRAKKELFRPSTRYRPESWWWEVKLIVLRGANPVLDH
jgi:hypothetical protein